MVLLPYLGFTVTMNNSPEQPIDVPSQTGHPESDNNREETLLQKLQNQDKLLQERNDTIQEQAHRINQLRWVES